MTPANDNDYQQLQRTIAELQVQNERLKADQARLDWLEKQATFRFTRWADGSIDVYYSHNGNAVSIQPETKSYRMAIDFAIEKEAV